jgi:hypothetical protein
MLPWDNREGFNPGRNADHCEKKNEVFTMVC